MAKTENLHSPTVREMNEHEHDYDRFISMMKWGTILSAITGFIVVFFIIR